MPALANPSRERGRVLLVALLGIYLVLLVLFVPFGVYLRLLAPSWSR